MITPAHAPHERRGQSISVDPVVRKTRWYGYLESERRLTPSGGSNPSVTAIIMSPWRARVTIRAASPASEVGRYVAATSSGLTPRDASRASSRSRCSSNRAAWTSIFSRCAANSSRRFSPAAVKSVRSKIFH